MKILGALMSSLLVLVAGFPVAFVMRMCVHHYAFLGMSKTRKKKIIKELSWFRRILMFYALKYNYQKRALFCILCYYIFCTCWILFICLVAVNVFIDLSAIPWLWLKRITSSSILLCLFSVFLTPKKKKK